MNLRPHVFHWACINDTTNEVSFTDDPQLIIYGPMWVHYQIYRHSSHGGHTVMTMDHKVESQFRQDSKVEATEAVILFHAMVGMMNVAKSEADEG